MTVQTNKSGFRIIESLDQLHYSALARARGTNNGGSLSLLKAGREIVQYFLLRTSGVPESNIFEFNFAAKVLHRLSLRII